MAAPKGNKYAKGNKGPAPYKYTTDFIEQEAIALVKWSCKPDNVYFKRFALERGYPPDELAKLLPVYTLGRRLHFFSQS